MKLSEIMNLVRKGIPSVSQKPRSWVPKPMEYPVTVYILSDKDFEIATKTKKFNKKLNSFALWEIDSEGNRVSKIYMRYHKLSLFNYEVRHLQKGHFYE